MTKKAAKTVVKRGKPGPKIGADGPAVVVAASLPRALVSELDRWCKRHGLGRSAAVKEAVSRLVASA